MFLKDNFLMQVVCFLDLLHVNKEGLVECMKVGDCLSQTMGKRVQEGCFIFLGEWEWLSVMHKKPNKCGRKIV